MKKLKAHLLAIGIMLIFPVILIFGSLILVVGLFVIIIISLLYGAVEFYKDMVSHFKG